MNNKTFVEIVKSYFSYLESEYGFRMIQAEDSEIRPQTDGIVRYGSNTTLLLVDSQTGYATVKVARIADGEKYYLTPIDIHEYLITSDEEKGLLLSTDPSDQAAASALFNKIFLLNQPGWKGNKGNAQDLEQMLKSFSSWLREHANFCLIGDFSMWPMFYEYKILRVRADSLRRGEEEFGYAQVKDSDGRNKLIRQSIFQDKLDHAERLKKEFSR